MQFLGKRDLPHIELILCHNQQPIFSYLEPEQDGIITQVDRNISGPFN